MNKKNKTLKTVILTAIISISLVTGVGVAAITLTAKEIGFTSTNEEWKVTNVEDAVNDLYSLKNEGTDSYLGTIPTGTSGTYTVSDLEFTPDYVVVYYATTTNLFVCDWIGEAPYGIVYNGSNATGGLQSSRSIIDNGFEITLKGTLRADAKYLAIKL